MITCINLSFTKKMNSHQEINSSWLDWNTWQILILTWKAAGFLVENCCHFWRFSLIYFVFYIGNRDDFKFQRKKLVKRILHALMLLKSHSQPIGQYESFDISIQTRWELAWTMRISWKCVLTLKNRENINWFKWHISIFWTLSITDCLSGMNYVV